MSNSDNKTPNWRSEPWASREAKAQEFFLKKEPPWKRTLKQWQDSYRDDPRQCLKDVRKANTQYKISVLRGIASGNIIVASESEDSIHQWMQERVDVLAQECGLFKEAPKLLIHTTKSKPGKEMEGAIAWVGIPGHIEIHDKEKNYFGLSGGRFRAIMAHEMGHLFNGDMEPENVLQHEIRRPNQKREILAERIGAIIYGNPREYAKWMTAFEDDGVRWAAGSPAKYNRTNLSANGNARMLHHWADILEREGGTDEKGNVIMDKAMAIYEKSKAFTEGFLEASMAFGLEMPRPGRVR